MDLLQPCREFVIGLSELFEEVSFSELVRTSVSVGNLQLNYKSIKTQLTFSQISHTIVSIMQAEQRAVRLV